MDFNITFEDDVAIRITGVIIRIPGAVQHLLTGIAVLERLAKGRTGRLLRRNGTFIDATQLLLPLFLQLLPLQLENRILVTATPSGVQNRFCDCSCCCRRIALRECFFVVVSGMCRRYPALTSVLF